VPRFKTTGDPLADILQASELKKERKVPDWAVAGPEGAYPTFLIVEAFCEMTDQRVAMLDKDRGMGLLRSYEKLCKQHSLTVDQMARAHEILPGENWGKWYLDHHKWSSGFEQKYVDQLVYAAQQIRDGVIDPSDSVASGGSGGNGGPSQVTGLAALRVAMERDGYGD
jgi:hypothetical protein